MLTAASKKITDLNFATSFSVGQVVLFYFVYFL